MADEDARRGSRFYQFRNKHSRHVPGEGSLKAASSNSEESVRKPLDKLKSKLNPLKRINLHKWFTDTRPVLEHVLFVRLQDINVTVSLNIPPRKRRQRKTYVPHERKSLFGLRQSTVFDNFTPKDNSNKKSILNKALDSYQKEEERARSSKKSKKTKRENLEDEAAKLDRLSMSNISDTEFENEKKSKVQFCLHRGQSLYENLVNYGIKGTEAETETDDVENRSSAKETKRSGRKKKKDFLPKSVLKTRSDNTNTSMNSSPTTGSLLSLTWSATETPPFHSPRNSLADEDALKIDPIGSVKLWDKRKGSDDVNSNVGSISSLRSKESIRNSDKSNTYADATRDSRGSAKSRQSRESRDSRTRMKDPMDDRKGYLEREGSVHKKTKQGSTSYATKRKSKGSIEDNGSQKTGSIGVMTGGAVSTHDKNVPMVGPPKQQEKRGSTQSDISHTGTSIGSSQRRNSDGIKNSVTFIQKQGSRGSVKDEDDQNRGSSGLAQPHDRQSSEYDKRNVGRQSDPTKPFDDRDSVRDMGKQSVETIKPRESRGSVKDEDDQNRGSSDLAKPHDRQSSEYDKRNVGRQSDSTKPFDDRDSVRDMDKQSVGAIEPRESKDSVKDNRNRGSSGLAQSLDSEGLLYNKSDANVVRQSDSTNSFDSGGSARDRGKQSVGSNQPRESRGSVIDINNRDLGPSSAALLLDNRSSVHDKGKQNKESIQQEESRGSVKNRNDQDLESSSSDQTLDNRSSLHDKGKQSVASNHTRENRGSFKGKKSQDSGTGGSNQERERGSSVYDKRNSNIGPSTSAQPFDKRDSVYAKREQSVGRVQQPGEDRGFSSGSTEPRSSRDSYDVENRGSVSSSRPRYDRSSLSIFPMGSIHQDDSKLSMQNDNQDVDIIVSSQPRESTGNANDVRTSDASPFDQRRNADGSVVNEREKPNRFSIFSARSREDEGSRNLRKSFMDSILKRETNGSSTQQDPTDSFHSIKDIPGHTADAGSNISFLSPRESKVSHHGTHGRESESESSFLTLRGSKDPFHDQGAQSNTSFFTPRDSKASSDDRGTGSDASFFTSRDDRASSDIRGTGSRGSFFTPRSSIQTTGSTASFQSVKDLKDSTLERLKKKRHDKDSNQNADTEEESHIIFTSVAGFAEQFQDGGDEEEETRPSMHADGQTRQGHTRDSDENELRWKLRAQVELMNDQISILLDENADLQQSLMTARTELTEKYDHQGNRSDLTSVKNQGPTQQDSVLSFVFRIFVYVFACIMGISIAKICSL